MPSADASSRKVASKLTARIQSAEREAKPSLDSWQALKDSVSHGPLALPAFSTGALFDAPAPRPSSELWADARSKCELLLDRLGSSHGGAELVAPLKAELGERRAQRTRPMLT